MTEPVIPADRPSLESLLVPIPGEPDLSTATFGLPLSSATIDHLRRNLERHDAIVSEGVLAPRTLSVGARRT